MKCARCSTDSVIKQGRQMLCEKHYRFGQMRANAKRHGKVVPTVEQLESYVSDWPVCQDCGRQMNWRSSQGRDTVASLQHYRDGTMAVVCLSCNSRHASMKDDDYTVMPYGHKFCPRCESVKPDAEFSMDNSRSGPRRKKSYCKECSNSAHKKWATENKEKYNEWQREYRAKRKASGNPVRRKS